MLFSLFQLLLIDLFDLYRSKVEMFNFAACFEKHLFQRIFKIDCLE